MDKQHPSTKHTSPLSASSLAGKDSVRQENTETSHLANMLPKKCTGAKFLVKTNNSVQYLQQDKAPERGEQRQNIAKLVTNAPSMDEKRSIIQTNLKGGDFVCVSLRPLPFNAYADLRCL